jgi:hypothetical protein
MTMLINVTPHAIHLNRADGSIETIPPSGTIARCAVAPRMVGEVAGIPLRVSAYGEVQDLPPPVDGTTYIASVLVVLAARRRDVVSPDDVVRDTEGKVIGCRALAGDPSLYAASEARTT